MFSPPSRPSRTFRSTLVRTLTANLVAVTVVLLGWSLDWMIDHRQVAPGRKGDLNVHGAFMHMVADAAVSGRTGGRARRKSAPRGAPGGRRGVHGDAKRERRRSFGRPAGNTRGRERAGRARAEQS